MLLVKESLIHYSNQSLHNYQYTFILSIFASLVCILFIITFYRNTLSVLEVVLILAP